MSAIGPKQTWPRALHMSAFGGKADMTIATATNHHAVGLGLIEIILACVPRSSPVLTFGD
jgi:hypothetical protein